MIDWVKKNKLATGLALIVLLFLAKEVFLPGFNGFFGTNQLDYRMSPVNDFGEMEMGVPPVSLKGTISEVGIPRSSAPPVEQEDRLVIEESSMSLLVKDVRESSDQIVNLAKETGGFMVNSSLSQPEEAPYGMVVIRVPADRFGETLDRLRGLSVKVVSENIRGTDVTSEYVDIEARIETLQKTKAKFESILEQANNVQDILQVQRELISLQDQIDNLTGQKRYLEQTAKLAKITIHLSTDELALPYAPSKIFRPAVIFKLAVRSLVLALRGLVSVLIWVGVYSIVWLPILLAIYFGRKFLKRRKSQI